jgi:hypothetical protein
MSATRCPRCGKSKKEFFSICWRCKTDDDLEAEYQRGYRDGIAASRPALDSGRIRSLIQLCHPDRHGGSRVAVDATQWLLDQRRAAR